MSARHTSINICNYWRWILWRLLLGYALKKFVKLIAVIVGLFISGLVYLQYQQIASFNWDNIEVTITSLANTIASYFND